MIFLTSYQLPVKDDEPYAIILWKLHNNVRVLIHMHCVRCFTVYNEHGTKKHYLYHTISKTL